MYEYKICELKWETGETAKVIRVLNNELLSIFLNSDIQGDGKEYLSAIDSILNEDIEQKEFTGNVCTIKITKKSTIIFDNFSGEESIVDTINLKK